MQTFAVSINDYIVALKDSEKMGKLVKALYNYGVSARIYEHMCGIAPEHLEETYTHLEDGLHIKECPCGDIAIVGHVFDENGKCKCGEAATLIYTFEELQEACENGGVYALMCDIDSRTIGLMKVDV